MVKNPSAFAAVGQEGMSLRDYFAGECCKGGADAICDNLSDQGEEYAIEHAARHAKAAYMVADAMLAEREKGAK